MLGKIIRHEFKDTSKICGLILLVVGVVTLLGALGIILAGRFFVNDGRFNDSVTSSLWVMMLVITMMVYVITLMGVCYGMMIYQGVHFYKTMYSDEGYLTQTLPVTKHQLLLGKTFVAGIWYLLVMVCVGISVVLLVFSLVFAVDSGFPAASDMREFWREMGDAFHEMGRMRFQVTHVVISAILALLITPFSTMMTMFGALTLGQLSGKYKALMGILAYFGVMIVNMILSNIVQFLFSVGGILADTFIYGGASMAVAYDSAIVTGLIMGGGMYFISHHILTKRLNME